MQSNEDPAQPKKNKKTKNKKRERERQEITKDMEKTKPLCIIGGNVSWYSHYGEQYGDSFKN